MAGYIGSKASVVSSGAERKKTFTITGATTSLTGLNYTVGKVHVFQNGVRLVDGTDYTATNGTTITLTVAAQSGDNVVVISQASFQVADALLTSGGTMTGDLSFGDNDKAKFGAGDDLQVYHDGSNSYIDDAGTGNLYLRASNAIIMQSSDGAETIASFHDDNLCRLYYDNSVKLSTTSTGATIRGDGDAILLLNTASDAGDKSLIRFGDNDDADAGYIDYDHGTNSLAFGASAAERMRIDSAGRLLVGTTTSGGSSGLTIQQGTNGSPAYVQWNKANSPSEGCMVFRFNGAAKGSVTYTSTGTAFNTTSDYRVKENVVDLTGASARVNQLDVKRFNFIDDETNTLIDGFLAHEVATVVPEAIHGTKDAMRDEEYEVTPAVLDDDGNVTTEAVMGTRSVPDYQGIDQSKLVPLLTAALQEALTEIASLKTRVEALEA
jgi:hypothetical protein